MKPAASSSAQGNSPPPNPPFHHPASTSRRNSQAESLMSSSSERASLLRQKEGPFKYDSLPFAHSGRGFRIRDTSALKTFITWFKSFRIVELLPSFAAGVLIWFLVKPNEDMNATSVHVLAVFISTIIALVTTSYEMSVIVLLALSILALTRSFTCETDDGLSIECSLCGHQKLGSRDVYSCDGFNSSFSQALSGYSDEITWLVVCAFQLGRAVEFTALGKRLSLKIIRAMGWAGVLGLGYAIAVSELLLGPFVPSNTARGGGIVKPIALSIARALESTPKRNPEAGRFLMMVGAHSNLISSSFYLTAMAANPLFISKARAVYPDLQLGFFTWIQGSVVPGLVTLAIVPVLLWKLTFSVNNDSYDAVSVTKHAEIELVANLRDASLSLFDAHDPAFKRLCLILLTCLTLWTTASWTHLPPSLIALAALPLLTLTDILTWPDIISNAAAWDTFIWLGGLTTLAHMLTTTGITHHLGAGLSYAVVRLTSHPLLSAFVLAALYNLSTIPFTSLSAHIVAFASVFLGSAKVLGTNPRVVIALFGGFGSLGGAMTNFSTGTIAMYYSEKYVSRARWIATGWLVMLVHLTVYATIGTAWWWALGWV